MKQDYNIEFSKGFTLIELLVTVALLGILAGGILMVLDIGGILTKANLTQAKKFSASIENSLSLSQVGKWSFEDGVGATVFKDTSGYSNNGSCSGPTCPTWQTTDQCGLFGGCLSFDGNDYVDIINSASAINNEQGTLAFWFKSPVVAANGSPFYYQMEPNPPLFGLSLSDDTYTGQLENEVIVVLRYIDASTCSYTYFAYTSTNAKNELYDDKWHFITIAFTGTATEIYLDANKKPITSAGGACQGNNDNVGKFLGYANLATEVKVGNSINGLIDEVQIYSQPLTLSQIQHLYATGLIKRAVAFRH